MLAAVVAAPGAAATAFEMLLAHKKAHGRVSVQLVRSVAELYGRSEDTIWRWLRTGRPGKRQRVPLSQEERVLLAECGGSVSKMVERLEKAGKASASLRTYQRRVNDSVTPAELAFYAKGDPGWRANTIHMPRTVERRGQVFHADHTLLKIWLVSKQFRRWIQVWLTVVLDAYSRRVMGWVVSLQPNEAVVLTALRSAFTGEHGCIPELMVYDNGAEFLANSVTQAAQSLMFTTAPIAPYSPWQNGKVERFFRTLNQSFLIDQPFNIRGPRGHNHKLYGPKGPLNVEEFVARLAVWIDEYNRERPHSALEGKTPDEVWRDPPTAVRRVDERLLDFMLMKETQRRAIGAHGVRHNNRWYFADELLSYTGDRIDKRFMPYDDRQIWLFDGDEFIAKAIPWEDAPERRLEAFLAKRTGTLNSARAKLRGSHTSDAEPSGSTFLPLTEASDFVSGQPAPSQPTTDELVPSLNEAAAAAAIPHTIEDVDDEGDDFEDDFDDLNEVIA